MKTLDLVLKRKWYDMISSGEKKEEYRELKPYWCKRICGCQNICTYAMPSNEKDSKICQKTGTKCLSGNKLTFDKVKFRNGYTSISQTYELEHIKIGYGDTLLGAPSDKPVFILKLGNKIE